MSKFIHKFFLWQFFVLLLCVTSPFCSAGINIEPDTIEKTGSPLEQIKDVITITNNQGKSVDVGVFLENWLKQEIDPNQWMKVEPNIFSLEPGESKKVNYTVDVIPGVTGELMCMIFFSVSDKDENKKNISIGMQIGFPLYVAVKDTVDFKVDIENCKLQLEGNFLKGDILVSNMSNVHIRPKIKAIVEGLDPCINPMAYAVYGAAVRAGERKYFSFSKETKNNVPEQCSITVIVNYGIGGMHDLELKKTFEKVKVSKVNIEEETAQETTVVEIAVTETAVSETAESGR